jgi:quinol monooxygenase YgiN
MGKEVKLIVLIAVASGKAIEQINLYKKLKPLVLKEKGCLEYDLNRISGSEVEFVLTERWESEECLAAHDEAPHMKEADLITPSFRVRPATVLRLIGV